MKVVVDRTRCTGLGICESLVPDLFEVSDAGEVVLLREEIGETERGLLEQAVSSCPTAALELRP